jgi:hypothetical protein
MIPAERMVFLKSAARRRSTLPTVVAWGAAGFSAEELREMAGVGVADFEGDIYHAHLRLAQPPPRFIHPQVDVVARR